MKDFFIRLFLSKHDIANMVRGTIPSNRATLDYRVEMCGSSFGFEGEWKWAYNFEKDLTKKELLKIYNIIREIKLCYHQNTK